MVQHVAGNRALLYFPHVAENIKGFVWLYHCYLGNALYQSSQLVITNDNCYILYTLGRFLNAWLNVCVSGGKKGNCEFNFCVCTWLYVVCKWLTLLLRSFKCDCGKNSQFAIIRLSHLKSVVRYYYTSNKKLVLCHLGGQGDWQQMLLEKLLATLNNMLSVATMLHSV